MNNQIFVLEPRCGLCNQLNCIAIGVVLGVMYNRNIYFHGFQLDYMNENELTNFEEIININHLIQIIELIDVKIKILKSISLNVNSVPKINTNDEIINNVKDIFSYLSNDCNMKEKILNLKNPISSYIPDEYQNLFNYIKLNIKFHDKFYKIANEIKEKYELVDYCCMHLRMEDDVLEFFEKKLNKDITDINDIHKQMYLNELNTINYNEIKIYICTSLDICENKNNLFYKIIKKKYNLIDKNDIINNYKLSNKTEQRELYGIIDYIIATDSIYFIGSDWSSFSIAIKNNHEHHKKDYNLLKIHDICLNA